MSKFQVVFIGIFVIFILGGVVLFATYKGKENTTSLPPITVWGTFPANIVNKLISELNTTRSTALVINYVQKDEANFNQDFIETLARGQGPDAVLIPQEMILRHEDKIIPIPSNIITERDFRNTYIPLSELYFSANKEALALPFAVDPLVMYWNRDIFTNAGIANYPRGWDEFPQLISKINQKDSNANIRRSAIAMGEMVNINNAREILGTLMLQSGNPVTTRGDATSGGGIVSTLGDGQFSGSKYSAPAVAFFTDFANPRSTAYSWNRSQPLSKTWFLSGALATYFGFASELFDLRAKNQNMNFDVAPMPQAKGVQNRITYGKMYGFSIVRSTDNPTNTYTALSALVTPQALSILSDISNLPPIRRDMIAAGSKDPYQAIFYDSALIARGWLDMDPAITSGIFQEMVESITSGRANVQQAIQTAHNSLNLSLRNN
jgi:ABC-type glycerol-3-phosphate transport system substrate-binding protein